MFRFFAVICTVRNFSNAALLIDLNDPVYLDRRLESK